MYSKVLSHFLWSYAALARWVMRTTSAIAASLMPSPSEPARGCPPPPPTPPTPQSDSPEYVVGRVRGRAEGQSELMLKLLSLRYGALQPAERRQVRTASWDDLQRVAERLFAATTLEQALGAVSTTPRSDQSNIAMSNSNYPPLTRGPRVGSAIDAAFARQLGADAHLALNRVQVQTQHTDAARFACTSKLSIKHITRERP